ncbi:MAG: hypothetical protein V1793_17485 [Pseudomonadota bacterium]
MTLETSATDRYELDDCIRNAVRKIDNFIESSTGKRASQQEMARAMTRYFVLNEILEFIQMDRK